MNIEISSIISAIKNGNYDHSELKIAPDSFEIGGAFNEPIGRPGATSVVFKAETKGGAALAIRFPKGILPGPEHWRRMRSLSELIWRNTAFPIVPFSVVDKAAKVDGEWIPAITMPYLEGGRALGDEIKDLYLRGDISGLESLSRRLARLGKLLQRSDWDHGDVSPGNIMVDERGDVCLIDPDTLRHASVPDPPVTELGHHSCSHPKRSVDRMENALYKFPLHSMILQVDYLSCCEPGSHRFEDDDCILLTAEDLFLPRKSKILAAIRRCLSVESGKVDSFVRACEATDVDSANSLLPEFYMAKPIPKAEDGELKSDSQGMQKLWKSKGRSRARKPSPTLPLRVPAEMKSPSMGGNEITEGLIVTLTRDQIRDGSKYNTSLVGKRVSERLGVSVGEASKRLGSPGYVGLLKRSGLPLEFEQVDQDPHRLMRLTSS